MTTQCSLTITTTAKLYMHDYNIFNVRRENDGRKDIVHPTTWQPRPREVSCRGWSALLSTPGRPSCWTHWNPQRIRNVTIPRATVAGDYDCDKDLEGAHGQGEDGRWICNGIYC